MRARPVATAGALLSLVLILPACGGERAASAGGGPATESRAESAARPAGDGRCRRSLHPFLARMDTLREGLVVGMSYEQYLDGLREVKAAYDGVQADRVPVGCLIAAGGPGERALNRYIDAANVWGDCLATASCRTESIEPKLQSRWALASDLLSAAQSGL